MNDGTMSQKWPTHGTNPHSCLVHILSCPVLGIVHFEYQNLGEIQLNPSQNLILKMGIVYFEV